MTFQSQKAASAAQPQATPPPTVAEARQFTDAAEKRLLDLWIKASRAQWVQETFITDDTEILAAQADQNVKAATSELAAQAQRFEPLDLPPDVKRKLNLIKLSVDIPSPRNPKQSAELSQINASLQSDYGKGKWCPDGAQGKCLSLNDLENIMATSRDPIELQRAWVGWHAIAPPMRERYSRMVELANEGAREVGFADVGAMWRSNYDMPPGVFARNWTGCGSRSARSTFRSTPTCAGSCAKKYGDRSVGPDGPIPADLLGNMWAQDWDNIYPLVAPPNADPGYDLTQILKAANRSSRNGPLRRALFHLAGIRAAAADFLGALDVRQTARPRRGVPRQRLGHGLRGRPAHENVHRASPPSISPPSITNWATIFTSAPTTPAAPVSATAPTTVSTKPSATPSRSPSRREYLVTNRPARKCAAGPSADIGLLMHKALEKVAFLPFGLADRQWRWKVFLRRDHARANTTKPGGSCAMKYQGVAPARRPQRRRTSIPARNITSRPTFPTRVIFWRTFCNSSFIARWPDRRLHRPAQSLLDLQQQGSRRAPGQNARNGPKPSLARSARSDDRRKANGRHGHPRLFRPAEKMAG